MRQKLAAARRDPWLARSSVPCSLLEDGLQCHLRATTPNPCASSTAPATCTAVLLTLGTRSVSVSRVISTLLVESLLPQKPALGVFYEASWSMGCA